MSFFDEENFFENSNTSEDVEENDAVSEETTCGDEASEKENIKLSHGEKNTCPEEASYDDETSEKENIKLSHGEKNTCTEEDIFGDETIDKKNIKFSNREKEVFPEGFFWAQPVKQPRFAKPTLPMAVAWSIVVVFGMAIILSAFMGRGWLANKLGGNKNIEFTLPLAERPALDNEFYQADGRYTTEGVANALEKSVVSIVAYSVSEDFMARGQGSGIIMTEDGYIVTNAHVISGYVENGVKVRLYDKTEYQAEIVGSDEKTDIAVLKINAKGLTPAQFGNSDQAVLGEEVVAMGSPAGLSGSISKGVISGLDREIRVDEFHSKMNCLQIDAAINPGNSGGALVNMWGQVIGIISSKLSSSDYDGIGFAISINDAKPIIEKLMEYGCVPGRVRIGITYYAIDSQTAEIYNMPVGFYINTIDPDCDIADSGIESGDIITEIDGVACDSTDALDELLEAKKPGDVLHAKVSRDGETFETSFKLMDDSGSLKVDDN